MTNIFNEWNYDTGEVVQYRRQGECNQCGDCCKIQISLRVAHWETTLDDPRNGGDTTTHRGVWTEAEEDGERRLYQITGVGGRSNCGSFEQGVCTIHSTKQGLCKWWPMSPSQITAFPKCSYTFTEIGRRKIDRTPPLLPRLDGMWGDGCIDVEAYMRNETGELG